MQRLAITSRQNPTVKHIIQLGKSARARREDRFISEGGRLIGRAIGAGYTPEMIVCCESLHGDDELACMGGINKAIEDAPPAPSAPPAPPATPATQWLDVPPELFNHMSYRSGGSGLLAVFARRQHVLTDMPIRPNGLYLILESPEKPGNIGAVARSADAAGADGLIICDQHTDIYNPNCQTASTGTIFSLPVALATCDELAAWLIAGDITLMAAVCDADSTDYRQADFSGTVAIAIGREHEGLSEYLIKAAHETVYIPMRGRADSLNASASASVLLFHATAGN